MYDTYVGDLLYKFNQRDSFTKFTRESLNSYTRFMDIIDSFRNFYNLTNLTRKELDQFLWIEGRRIALARK